MTELHQHTVDDVGNEDRDVTTEVVLDLDIRGDECTVPLSDLIDSLTRAMEKIPPAYRDAAVVEFTAYGDYASMSGEVRFKRPETDEEYQSRKRWLASIDAEREERDRQEYQRLNAKYSPLPVVKVPGVEG